MCALDSMTLLNLICPIVMSVNFKPEFKKYQSIVGAGLGTQFSGLTITEQQNPPFINVAFKLNLSDNLVNFKLFLCLTIGGLQWIVH
jgi:hypothetical protein